MTDSKAVDPDPGTVRVNFVPQRFNGEPQLTAEAIDFKHFLEKNEVITTIESDEKFKVKANLGDVTDIGIVIFVYGVLPIIENLFSAWLYDRIKKQKSDPMGVYRTEYIVRDKKGNVSYERRIEATGSEAFLKKIHESTNEAIDRMKEK